MTVSMEWIFPKKDNSNECIIKSKKMRKQLSSLDNEVDWLYTRDL